MDSVGWQEHVRPGYRLKKLEVTNWGTFDSSQGQVTSLELNGRTGLLVGQNGSGKSTLVDALLTLLVQPGVRNYNVAAGAKKRERDERTYIRGACGRLSDDQQGSKTDYLRPHDKHYSVLLACFEREATGAAFSVVQVLQIAADGEVDKTYAFDTRERSIAADLSGLQRGQRIAKQLAQRGFRTTKRYTEYLSWFADVAHLRPKAMDVFNQTVAVKDIQSLNRFIRDHMLEAHPWRDRIEGLLGHFHQLSLAHQSLLKARRQVHLLTPIEAAAAELDALSVELDAQQQRLDAVDSFFRQQACRWLEPRRQTNSAALLRAQQLKRDLQSEIDALDERQRLLKNEIEQTGGERLRQLPLLLETQTALFNAKQREQQRLRQALKSIGGIEPVETREQFQQLPEVLEAARSSLAAASSRLAEERLNLARQLTDVRTAIDQEQVQLDLLQQRAGNLPSGLEEARAELARELQLPTTEIPFACELIGLRDDELAWQPVIEILLRKLALSLLVPERHFRALSSLLRERSLYDAQGEGQRLVCLCVPDRDRSPPQEAPYESLHADSLVRKLRPRDEHPLTAWLNEELCRNYDYRCCETAEQFERAPAMAVTPARLVKLGSRQLEKDDRPRAVDPRRFVLGWDNAGRISQLRESLDKLHSQARDLERTVLDCENESRKLSRRLAAIDMTLAVPEFDLIDTARHQREIDALQREQAAIEDSNESVKLLRRRLDETIELRFAAQQRRDDQVAMEGNLVRENDWAAQMLQRHTAILSARAEDGSLAEHQLVFTTLEDSMRGKLETPASYDEFAELQAECSRQFQLHLNALHERIEPLRADVVRGMQKFLSENPEERNDLRADLRYVDGFLGLLEQIRADDLPRHEERFRQRLNDKVIQEIGVFHAALQCERHEILAKIETLNASLEQLEYRSGTYMRLEARENSDREIRDFQNLLRECLSDPFDGHQATDETRFVRIQRLIDRLRDEERWRDKVTDVRGWFDFAARELDVVDGAERGCYEDSGGQSGGEKAKLAFTILVAAIAYQFDIDPHQPDDDRLHFVVVDEMFSKVDDRYAEYALQLFEKFGLQLLIVAPLDAKARVTEPYVGCYHHTVKNERKRVSEVYSLTAVEYEQALGSHGAHRLSAPKPR